MSCEGTGTEAESEAAAAALAFPCFASALVSSLLTTFATPHNNSRQLHYDESTRNNRQVL